ncbi:hypothetical protein J2W57_000596 [Chryseobacterium ginsenosidimutans]|jgi:hypothetical protein|uniref:Uncharacterized protein n=1 Tax=Chryseobacterium geocarposphaerae TaxID=1416776 RepID=A0ABU1LAF8_9FLAO|nr:hypothetical protein [Chryseobacterium geocarposphaerae]MDR6697247.1 hypothetical protein [Chryseobacterium ginsenosidimutans]
MIPKKTDAGIFPNISRKQNRELFTAAPPVL